MNKEILEIDIVFLWVDGNDTEWQKKKRAFTGAFEEGSETNAIGRYMDNQELKYALRSVEAHAPWIRNIFIVTDNQTPAWLDISHPKIHMIDHKDILPKEVLPCFNSSVIEYFLYKIPSLSDHFLCANDDTFFNTDLAPDFFFAEDGYPIIRLKRKILGKLDLKIISLLKALVGKELGQYRAKVAESATLVYQKTGKYFSSLPHHNIDAYRKSEWKTAIEDVFNDQVQSSQFRKVRTYGDFHRSALSYYALATGHGHLKYVGRKQSLRILVHKQKFMNYLNKYKPHLFCLNDSQRVSDMHRKEIKPFLKARFPIKSQFEK